MEGEQLSSREIRIARNEALFREVNERVRELSAEAPLERLEFLCECGRAECTDTVALDRDEYERIRSDALLFVVKPGHGVADVEDVVSSHERYQVVQKHPEEAHIAQETDPRG